MAKAKKVVFPEVVYGFEDGDGMVAFDEHADGVLGFREYRKRVGVYVLDHESEVTAHYTTTVVQKKRKG